jgi:hypothetical protein
MTPGPHSSYSYPAHIKSRHLRGYKLDVVGQDAHIDRRINSHQLVLDVERVHRVAKIVVHNRWTYLRKMMTLYPTDFIFAVFTASDRLQHVTWHRQDLITDFWRELDSIVGEIYSFALECGYTHFLVVSDHGFCDVDSPAAEHHLRRCGKPGINHHGVHRLEGTYIHCCRGGHRGQLPVGWRVHHGHRADATDCQFPPTWMGVWWPPFFKMGRQSSGPTLGRHNKKAIPKMNSILPKKHQRWKIGCGDWVT